MKPNRRLSYIEKKLLIKKQEDKLKTQHEEDDLFADYQSDSTNSIDNLYDIFDEIESKTIEDFDQEFPSLSKEELNELLLDSQYYCFVIDLKTKKEYSLGNFRSLELGQKRFKELHGDGSGIVEFKYQYFPLDEKDLK